MTKSVVTVGTDALVSDIARLLTERHISGVPVVDAQNRMVGIVTVGDLLRRSELGTEKHRGWWQKLLTPNADLAADFVQSHGSTAEEVMTRKVIQVAPQTSLATVVDILERNRIRRVPVVDRGELVGIVSRSNLVQALGSVCKDVTAPSADDRRIREDVVAAFRKLPWATHSRSNIVVTSGVVHLWGLVNTPQEQAALRVAAETMPGVRAVEDHTILVRDDWHLHFRHRSAG